MFSDLETFLLAHGIPKYYAFGEHRADAPLMFARLPSPKGATPTPLPTLMGVVFASDGWGVWPLVVRLPPAAGGRLESDILIPAPPFASTWGKSKRR